jgi:hypothetical protein
LIDFRLRQAGYKGAAPLFTNEAIRMIWEHTRGYPRKLSLCCHNALENLVMYDKKIVDEEMVRNVIDAEVESGSFAGLAGPVTDRTPEEDLCRVISRPSVPTLTVRYGS